MKLALVVSLAPDRRSGVVQGEPMPADKAISMVKDAINAGRPLNPRFPLLAAVALDSILRQHTFKGKTAAEIEAFDQLTVVPEEDALNAALAANAALEEQVKELTAKLEAKADADAKAKADADAKAKADADAKAKADADAKAKADADAKAKAKPK